MPDESTPSPETPPPYDPARRVRKGLADDTTRNEGSTIIPDANPRPLEVIGDFEILGKLGQGGMGTVYRAWQVSLDRQVALKILPSHFEADPDYVTRFQREARVAASLRHANLVKVYSSGQINGCHYIAMELIEGETLSQWVKRGRLPPLEALRIILDVTRALECGWRTAQLIHRDIKPGNIFLSVEGEVKLGDLGLAKIVGADTTGLTHTGTAMGTPHYISPEQARGDRDLDFRADIYSLGCTLYQMLTKQTPYSGHDPMVVMSQHINAPPPAILKVMPHCPIPLGRLVSKMLRKQRRERHASYEELIAAIESVRVALDPTLAAPAVLAPSRPDPIMSPAALKTSVQEVPIQGRPGSVSLPAPKKTALYGGIGVLVLAVAAFFLWPKEGKLTKAQLYAHDHAAELKAATEAEAALAGATKDAPFVNSLGMKFVPVPILGGPTGGQRVLFSVWDTRVQDYQVFATETKREWKNAGLEQGPTHPAVNVSWEDARAFCTWLTERERKAGKLSPNEASRLPSDHEWSCAVGIGEREDAAKLPNEKQQKVADVYPWGTQWPPPRGKVGNYADETFHAKFPPKEDAKDDWAKNRWIEGYTDGYATTSPVGSFPANAYGLYDMGGNVQQWCEDWFDASHKERVLRGAAWGNDFRGALLSSNRGRGVPGYRNGAYGFRCVAAPASVASQASANEGGKKADAGEAILAREDTPPTPNPITATKDASFVNTLGMKFVPVPIVSGPTAGQRVLFSVWDTRVQDYAAYAGAKKVDDAWTKQAKDGVPVGRELNHPVVGVSWEDAQGFCQWLTEKETAEGRLPKGAKYRLPTDEEWSWAVGLPPELGTTPAEKSVENIVDFPWGKDWPPTKKVGNYADEAFHAKFPPKEDAKDDWSKNRWIEGYTDGYATTSPVGSFPAHAYGLYDMGGNVWQWCEDWFDAAHKERVLRGASWEHYVRGLLLSSYRHHNVPGHRTGNYGFRCVLAPASTPPPIAATAVQAASSTLATATKGQPFVNTLGMKFVPVPILGGPTAGQTVLFSVWDTRVQDYGAYADAKKVDEAWTKANKEGVPVGRELNHPVVGVSWEDAQGFCQWLTEKEIAEGKLPKGLKYRLPTDEEWSWAVGLPPELGATPAEKSQKNNVDFPWGKDYPPTKKVGNYADETFHGKFPPKKNEKENRMENQWIEGYTDGYAATSPVGSFPANAYGLYDMGGNVWQWCEDWFDASRKERMLRGASWFVVDRGGLLSSARDHVVPGSRYRTYGFRCVVVGSAL